MVAEVSNTQVSVYRGTTVDATGYPADAATPVLQGLDAFLAETGQLTQDPSSPTPRTIRQIVCKVPAWTRVTTSDRIYDERTGDTYMVITVTRPPTLDGTHQDLTLNLKRVTATGT